MESSTLTSIRYRFGTVTYDLASRTHVMGILNVTPDSFSDGGAYFDTNAAVSRALQMIEEGADFIDIGGESTRPGSEPVTAAEELRRVMPVVERLADASPVPISIDTYKAEVADAALAAGACIVNDISGLHADDRLADVAAAHSASMVLMHMQGSPRTMQQDPRYGDVIGEISSYLQVGIDRARKAGITQIIIDPGVGFGKKLEHNLTIFKHLGELQHLGYPVLVGPSRKSFLSKLLGLPVDQRAEGTAAAVAVSIMNGANIVRVHDVKEMKRIAGVVDAVRRAS